MAQKMKNNVDYLTGLTCAFLPMVIRPVAPSESRHAPKLDFQACNWYNFVCGPKGRDVCTGGFLATFVPLRPIFPARKIT